MIFRTIILFVLSILCAQAWSYTISPIYAYDVSEYRFIDQNIESENIKLNYDDSPNLSKPVNYLPIDSSGTKSQFKNFLAFIEGFIVTKSAPNITKAYKRPSGATTKAQRQSVQGKPCVDCGAKTSRQFADHKDPLVKEYSGRGRRFSKQQPPGRPDVPAFILTRPYCSAQNYRRTYGWTAAC